MTEGAQNLRRFQWLPIRYDSMLESHILPFFSGILSGACVCVSILDATELAMFYHGCTHHQDQTMMPACRENGSHNSAIVPDSFNHVRWIAYVKYPNKSRLCLRDSKLPEKTLKIGP